MLCLPARAHVRVPHLAPRRWALLLAALLLTLAVTACGEEAPPPSAQTVLAAMEEVMETTAQTLPEGVTYLQSAEQTEGDGRRVLTEALFSALYGEAARGLLTAEGGVPPVNDAAVFLSMAPYPCELAVFRCSDVRTAATVAGLCRGRLDVVARGYAESEWREVAAGGRVAVEGCYVLLAVAEDPETVLLGAARAVRGRS